ncbi:MAG: hypothetical protein FWD31_11685, partial [Planctomycetaceae bacterium]|nr:hypothetical protein [Planctomycetaceae bacterium]
LRRRHEKQSLWYVFRDFFNANHANTSAKNEKKRNTSMISRDSWHQWHGAVMHWPFRPKILATSHWPLATFLRPQASSLKSQAYPLKPPA